MPPTTIGGMFDLITQPINLVKDELNKFQQAVENEIIGLLPLGGSGGGVTASGGVQATGSIFINTLPDDGDTITVNGINFYFKTSASGDYEIQIGGTTAITATNAAAKLNASAEANVALATYVADGSDVDITHETPGTIGNSFTLAENSTHITVSGATLTGGLGPLYTNQLIKGAGGATLQSGDLSGAVTTSGSMVTSIANNAVALANLAQIATDSFLGRDTAGTGNVEVLSIATVQTMLGIGSDQTSFLFTNQAAPATPASGKTILWADSTDKRIHDKNDTGSIGTTVVADTGAANNFLTAISTAGVISKAQPSISSLSDASNVAKLDAANVFSHATGQSMKKLLLPGSSSGTLTIQSAAAAGTNTLTLPAGTTDFSATGGTSYVLRQNSTGAAITVSQLAASDLSNGTTGSGKVVLENTPTLITPVLGVATATSINKVAFTTPATSATLTIANGKTLTANSSLTLAGVDSKTLTVNNSLTLAGVDGKSATFNNSLTFAGTDGKSLTLTGSLSIGADTSITGGGTLALATYTATVPATGTVAMGAATLTVSTTNNTATATHTHAITSSANPGAAASLLASDSNGYLQLVRLGIGVAPTQPLEVGGNVFINAATANLYLKDTSTGWQVSSSTVIMPQASNAVRSTTYTSGIVGWNINAAGDAEFNNIAIRGELRASVFKVSELTATAGTFGVFYSASTLLNAATTPASGSFNFDAKNSDAGGMLFAVNDVVRFKTLVSGGIGDAWATITARTNHTTYTTYTATLNSGSTNTVFPAGSAVADYGPSGTGFITLSTDGTVGSTPNMTMATHAGSPWSSFTTLLRLGNLNGAYGYATNVYGLGLGQYGTTQSWLTFDTTNGIRIGNNTTTLAQWSAAGVITVGQVSASQSNIIISSGALDLRVNTTVRIHLATDGSGYLANSNISWDTSGNLTVAGNASIAGWTINSTSLYSGSGSTRVGLDSTSTGGDDVRFYAGSETKTSAPFRVTESGAVTATSGVIGGWTLGTTSLVGGGITLQAASLSTQSTATCFGDSITKGTTGPSDYAHSYASLTATAKSWTLTNSAVDGSQAADQADAIYGTTVSGTSRAYWYAIGVNDERLYLTDAGKLTVFRYAHLAEIAWLAIPDSAKYKGVSGSWSYSGSWSNSAAYGLTFGKTSNTLNDTATISISGTVIYFSTIVQNNNLATFTIKVDGNLVETTSSTPAGTVTTYLGRTYAPRLIRIAGLTSGSHTVEIKVTSSGGASNAVYVDWITGNGVSGFFDGPPVYVPNITRQTAAGYAANGGSDANTDTYNAAIAANIATLVADGLGNVVAVDFHTTINPTTDTIIADGLHINDAGNVKLKDALVAATLTLPSNKIFVGNGLFGNANTPFYADGSGRLSLKDKLSWDGETLAIVGNLTATAGTIGGWTIGPTRLSSTNIHIDQAGQYISIGNNPASSFYRTPAVVNTATGANWTGSNFTQLSTSSTINCTTGNAIVVYVTHVTSATVTVADTAGNTYVEIANTGISSQYVHAYYAKNITGHATNTVTMTAGSNVQWGNILVLEYSGLDSADPLDVSVTKTQASATSVTSPTFTTTWPNEAIIAGAFQGTGSTPTAGSGFTLRVTGNSIRAVEDKYVTSIQTSTTASMTGDASGDWGMVVITMKAQVFQGVFLDAIDGGRFSLYKDGNNYLQWNNGQLLLKCGNLTIDNSGISIKASTAYSRDRAFRVSNSIQTLAAVWAADNPGTNDVSLQAFSVPSTSSTLNLYSDSPTNHTSQVFIDALVDGTSNCKIWMSSANGIQMGNPSNQFWLDPYGNIRLGTAGALATTATDGFTYLQSMNGTPSGTPRSVTGKVPIVYDTANNKFYVYNSGWKQVALAA